MFKHFFDKIKHFFVRPYVPQAVLSIYFGVPGSGKTTFAAYLAAKDLRHGSPVWSNVPIKGTFQFEPQSDIGKWFIHDGRVIIDEAGIEYDSRKFKSFSDEATYFYKYHRHAGLAVDVFSQGFEDCDKKIRTLASRLYVVRRGLLPWFIHRREIRKVFDIDQNTKQPIDGYSFVPVLFGGLKVIFSPPLWKLFNSFDYKDLPERDSWPVW